MIYYVAMNGNNSAAGTQNAPFRTINHAAQVAVAGDIVRVHGGTYQEWVDPKNGGTDGLTQNSTLGFFMKVLLVFRTEDS